MNEELLFTYGAVLATLWGAVWGSFANVVVHRLPRGMSVVRPSSHCPSCGTPLRAWHNIPVVSWLLLRGKCGHCKAPISPRYMVVEVIMALLALATYQLVRQDSLALTLAMFAVLFVFVFAMVVITFIDLEFLIIPNVLSLPGIVVGIGASFLLEPVTGVSPLDAVAGAVVGGGSIFLLIFVYLKITGREGMGGGDFKLTAMIGAFLGYQSLPFLFWAASIQGLLLAVPAFLIDRRASKGSDDEGGSFRHMAIPFGPFLALAALEWLVFREPIMALWTSLLEGGG